MPDRLPPGKLRSPGEARRRRELELPPVGAWRAIVTVDAVTTNHGRHTTAPYDHLFEVAVEWTGPPAKGFPHSDTPVHSRDAYLLTTLEDATALARKAHDAYAAAVIEPPDLRELAGLV